MVVVVLLLLVVAPPVALPEVTGAVPVVVVVVLVDGAEPVLLEAAWVCAALARALDLAFTAFLWTVERVFAALALTVFLTSFASALVSLVSVVTSLVVVVDVVALPAAGAWAKAVPMANEVAIKVASNFFMGQSF